MGRSKPRPYLRLRVYRRLSIATIILAHSVEDRKNNGAMTKPFASPGMTSMRSHLERSEGPVFIIRL